LADQPVEQGRLADIGPAYDNNLGEGLVRHGAAAGGASLPAWQGKAARTLSLAGLCDGRIVAEILEPGLDRTVELDGQRVAVAVHRLAGLHPHPAFGNAVFLDIG